MIARLGLVVYLLACLAALLGGVLAVVIVLGGGYPAGAVFVAVASGAMWLAGRFILWLFAGA